MGNGRDELIFEIFLYCRVTRVNATWWRWIASYRGSK